MTRYILLLLAFIFTGIEAKLPTLTPDLVHSKSQEIMRGHASHKELSPFLVKRILSSYIDGLDPTKTYFIEEDITQWTDPSDELTQKTLDDLQNKNYKIFEKIHSSMKEAIDRRHQLDEQIDLEDLPKNVSPSEFRNMEWTKNEEQLLERLKRIKALQIETAAKLTNEFKENSLERIKKRQLIYEDEILNKDSEHHRNFVLTNVLKAITSSLDSHTTYFTPAEAEQFMINVQQRLYGIGAQLRDDLNGFTIVKIVEGGPAARGKELKAKDRVIAVDREPVVGMDIIDAVELIRGKEGTPVILTVIREVDEKEEKLDITIIRGEVVLKDSRFEVSYEPFGDGIIAYLKLYSFYQDHESSSTSDLSNALTELKKEHNLEGVVLDLRFNSGGMLSQAVGVSGLFITKGVVVSIKDENGKVQHLRNLETDVAWGGPLVVLVNRASASASEIVAGTLQDYGRAIIIGDDHTYGKGSFQTFTLTNAHGSRVNPEGEYKVTRGRYYTVSGSTPQLNGVQSDIEIPGPLSEMDIGEKFTKYPLEGDRIPENFDDDLSDIPSSQRDRVRLLYKYNLQKKLDHYDPFMDQLQANSKYRIENNKNYQNFLKELKKETDPVEGDAEEHYGQNDLQLTEAFNVVKDLILLTQ